MKLCSPAVLAVALGGAFLLPAPVSSQDATRGQPPAATGAPILPAATAAQPAASPEATADLLNFTQDSGARMSVPVSVLGRGPYRFLVDTGAERTVISKELAARLMLDAGADVRIHSMTDALEVGTAVIPQLQFSKKQMHDIEAPAFPAINIGAAGMLGVDSLKMQRVVFDFGRKTMAILPAQRREDWGPDVIVVTGRSLYGRLVLVDASLEGENILVVIDTGSEVTIGNEALRKKLIAKRKLQATTSIDLVSITGGRTSVDYTQVKRIEIGGMSINNMPIGFGDVHVFKQLRLLDRPAILLGMDALSLFDRVAVDFARKEVRFLRPNDGVGEYIQVPS
jgi:predicted aspartyl protease